MKKHIKLFYKILYYSINLGMALFVYYSLHFFLKLIGKNISRKKWIIGDSAGKYYDANANAIFEYLLKNTEEKVYFVLNSNSNDYNHVKKTGPTLKRFSFLANFYALTSKVMIFTHHFNDIIRCNRIHLNNVFMVIIDHGVYAIKKKSETCAVELRKVNFIVCVSECEKKRKLLLQVNRNQLNITGLPRFDTLNDKSKFSEKKTILYMPTWRPQLYHGNIKVLKNHDREFLKSEFYKKIIQIFQSNKLKKILEENNLVLKICFHKFMHRYLPHISNDNKNNLIKILPLKEKVQKHLNNSAILITDYSSVCWDFLYLDKPSIFYQFDYENYFSKYYESCIDLEKDLPGPIVKDLNQLISMLTIYNTVDFRIEEKYLKLKTKQFSYNDKKNSERLYKAIRKTYIIN